MSTLGDLTNKVKRFGKTPNTVPGTYMSAAGVQTEIHPTTLARLAVHETYYRRQVHVYQQDLENAVHRIQKDQKLMKRSFGEYKKKLHYNQKNKYICPFHSASGESIFSTSTWSTASERGPAVFKVVQRGGKKVRIMLPQLGKKAWDKDNKTMESKQVEGVSKELKPPEILHVSLDEPADKDGTGKIGEMVSSEDSLDVEHDVTEIHFNRSKKDPRDKITETSVNEGTKSNKNSKKSKEKKADKRQQSTGRSNMEETVDSMPPAEIHTKDLNEDNQKDSGDETAPDKEMGDDRGFVTDKDAVMTVLNRSKPPQKHIPSKKSDTDTSSFMELVRMKNKFGLVKNMKVVDELIQHSKTRSFAYLTKVTESREDLAAGREIAISKEVPNGKSELYPVDHISGGHDVPNVVHGSDEVDNETDDSIAISEIFSLDVGTPKSANGLSRHIRKANVIIAPDTEKLPYISRDGTNFSLFASRNPSQLLPGRSQLNEIPISMRVSLSPGKVNKFLKDEKAKSSNYKADVSWQQSLASIKDVHYIRNKDDFQNFAKSVIHEKN